MRNNKHNRNLVHQHCKKPIGYTFLPSTFNFNHQNTDNGYQCGHNKGTDATAKERREINTGGNKSVV